MSPKMHPKINYIRTVIICGFLVTAAAFGAWEKVPLPEIFGPIREMEFANADLGYILVSDDLSPDNFLVYQNGHWYHHHLTGMFLGMPTGISLLPSGYGWVGGSNGGMDMLVYTGRSWGAGVWEKVENPYPQGSHFVCLSVPEQEFVVLTFMFDDTIKCYNNGVWEDLPGEIPAELGNVYDIQFLTKNEGWACGFHGFAHYGNDEWEYIYWPNSIQRIDFTGVNDGWAADYYGGSVLHYDGSSWREIFNVPGYKAYEVSFCDCNNGWATFFKYGYGWKIYKYEYGNWREITPPENYLRNPCAVSPNTAWFVSYESEYPQKPVTWRWTTESSLRGASLGKIKARYK